MSRNSCTWDRVLTPYNGINPSANAIHTEDWKTPRLVDAIPSRRHLALDNASVTAWIKASELCVAPET
jgi:hypothetical protein